MDKPAKRTYFYGPPERISFLDLLSPKARDRWVRRSEKLNQAPRSPSVAPPYKGDGVMRPLEPVTPLPSRPLGPPAYPPGVGDMSNFKSIGDGWYTGADTSENKFGVPPKKMNNKAYLRGYMHKHAAVPMGTGSSPLGIENTLNDPSTHEDPVRKKVRQADVADLRVPNAVKPLNNRKDALNVVSPEAINTAYKLDVEKQGDVR